MNAITLTGNLVADPERVEYTTKDGARSLVNFRMGNNELVNGESVSNGFFDVTVFGPQAAHVLGSFKKGDRLMVTGRLEHSIYERQDGSKGGRTKMVASEVGASLAFNTVEIDRNKPSTSS